MQGDKVASFYPARLVPHFDHLGVTALTGFHFVGISLKSMVILRSLLTGRQEIKGTSQKPGEEIDKT
jgi:hypothetical protein